MGIWNKAVTSREALQVEENERKVVKIKPGLGGFSIVSKKGVSKGTYSWIVEFGRGHENQAFDGWFILFVSVYSDT